MFANVQGASVTAARLQVFAFQLLTRRSLASLMTLVLFWQHLATICKEPVKVRVRLHLQMIHILFGIPIRWAVFFFDAVFVQVYDKVPMRPVVDQN